MSSRSSKPQAAPFGRDIHRLLRAAEDGHKAEILLYTSGHLGARSPVQSQSHKETKLPFWSTSEKHSAAPKYLTPRKQQSEAEKKNMKDYLAEVKADFASLTVDQALATAHPKDSSFDAVPREAPCLNNALPCMRKPLPKIRSKYTSPKKSENTSSQRVQLGSDKDLKQLRRKPHDLVNSTCWRTNSLQEYERKLESVSYI